MSVSRDYALNVTATIKDYEKKLGDVPGVTQKEARKAALALHNELVKGQRQAVAAAKAAAGEAAKAWGSYGTGAAGKAAALAAANAKLTDTERAAAKAMLDAEVATIAKAEALGVTVAQLRQLEAASERAAKSEAEQAKAASKATEAMREAQAHLYRWTQSAENAADGAARAGDAVGKFGSSTAKLAGFADMLPGPLGEGVRAAADFADVGEVAAEAGGALGLSLGSIAALALPVAAAIGAAALAYRKFAADAEAAEQRLDEQRKTLETVAQLHRRVKDAAIEAAVAEGKMTREQGDRLLTAATAADTFAARREELTNQLRQEEGALHSSTLELAKHEQALRAAAREIDPTLTGYDHLEQKQVAASASTGDLSAKVRNHAGNVETLRTQLGQLDITQQKYADSLLLTAGGEGAATDAASKFQEQVDALRESLAKREEQRQQEAAFIQLSAESEMRAIFATMDAEAAAAEQARELAEEEKERIAEVAEARRAANQAHVSAYGDMFGSISQIAATFSEKMAEKDKRAALVAFRVSQAAALAQAGINTALAISNALAQPVPPPVAAALAVAAGLAGGVQVAAIASQSPPAVNDTPGPLKMNQRRTMSFGSDDIVVAARDPREVQRQAASLTGSRGDSMREEVVSVSVVDGRAIGRRIIDDVALRTRTRRAIATTGRAANLRLGKEEAA
jgi:hypothetical protein